MLSNFMCTFQLFSSFVLVSWWHGCCYCVAFIWKLEQYVSPVEYSRLTVARCPLLRYESRVKHLGTFRSTCSFMSLDAANRGRGAGVTFPMLNRHVHCRRRRRRSRNSYCPFVSAAPTLRRRQCARSSRLSGNVDCVRRLASRSRRHG